jgi:hypothetical protein
MSKKLSINDIVVCRLYNTLDKKFYGRYFKGIIIGLTEDHKFKVKDDCSYVFTMNRKEIKHRIK